MTAIKYSMCILALNHLDITKRCIQSIEQTNERKSIELILIDNGSFDGTREWLERYAKQSDCWAKVIFHANEVNKGCVVGRNQAISMATGEFVVLLDNDVEVLDASWLSQLTLFYLSQDDAGIVGPKMLYKNEQDKIQQVGFGVTKTGNIGYWGQGAARNEPKYNQICEFQGYPAACWLIKRELFTEHGTFDEIYSPVNYEDVDFCYRIRAAGWKIYYYPKVELLHHEHITTRNTQELKINRVTLKNGVVFKKRWKHMFEKEEGMRQDEVFWEQKLPSKKRS